MYQKLPKGIYLGILRLYLNDKIKEVHKDCDFSVEKEWFEHQIPLCYFPFPDSFQ